MKSPGLDESLGLGLGLEKKVSFTSLVLLSMREAFVTGSKRP